jgi:phage terminase large subunit-like protein
VANLKQRRARPTRPTRAPTRGERNIQWIEQYCVIPEGGLVGTRIKLSKEQKQWVRDIYDSPTRRIILSMARKQGKTAFAACLLLLHLAGPESRPNSQLYSAAQSRDQAGILFSLAAKIVRLSPSLSGHVGIRDTAKQLYCAERGTLYRALSADASTSYGLSPAFVVHDELGQVRGPRSELYEAIETAMGAQEDPLSVIISTQAPTDADLLSMLIDDAKSGRDPRTKLVLYSADEALDPFSEEAIREAAPHYNLFMNKQEVRDTAEAARRMPSREASYRNLILNQRVNTSNPFVSRNVWESCGGEADPSVFDDARVFLGLDLSARVDLTSIVAVAQDDDGVWHTDATFFAPEIGIVERSMRDRAPYDQWAADGFIRLTPGASVDYDTVAVWLAEYAAEHDVRSVHFDRWRIDVLESALGRLGVTLPLESFGQGYKDMAPALDALEAELLLGKVRHGMHPVLTMCAANAVATIDSAGNRKLDKAKATGRIDGMVAMAMAIGGAAAQPIKARASYSIHVIG